MVDPDSSTNDSSSKETMNHMRRFEGQLNKFTNVVKGWQYRWFVLDPAAGTLEYYLLEERSGRCRGSQRMSGAVIIPSQDDENTFNINFKSGESYKVRASSAKERQVWVDRLRHCACAVSADDDLPDPGHLPLSSRDSFGAVHDALQEVLTKEAAVCAFIDSLPVPKPDDSTSPSCFNTEMLKIKANSQALTSCLHSSLDMLQMIRERELMKPLVSANTPDPES